MPSETSARAPQRAAVLAGGLGTRLRPYTTVLPKPLIPVGDRPILELILHWLADHGVREVDVCVGHLGELIQTYFSQSQTIPRELELRWVWETAPRGTAGALAGIAPLHEALLVVNGDVLTDLDPAEMLSFHRERGASLTIATRTSSVAVDLGVVEHDDRGRVTDYVEKPVLSYEASMGVYLYQPSALQLLSRLSADAAVEFPDLVLALLAAGEPVEAFHSASAWEHVGTIDQHRLASLSEKWLQLGHNHRPSDGSVG